MTEHISTPPPYSVAAPEVGARGAWPTSEGSFTLIRPLRWVFSWKFQGGLRQFQGEGLKPPSSSPLGTATAPILKPYPAGVSL